MSRAAHLLPLLLLLLSLTGLRAQTPPTETPSRLVTTPLDTVDATDGLTSLREAILHLNAGLVPDTILFALPLGSNRTVVLSANLPAVTAPRCYINGSNRGPDTGRVTLDGGGTHALLHFSYSHATIDSLILANGHNGNPGGAILASSTTLHVSHCLFLNNHATHSGGALYCGTTTASTPPSLVVTHCLFLNNHSLHGGAIVIENCDTCRLTTSRFLHNSVLTNGFDSHGGALKVIGSPCIIYGCQFSHNHALVATPDIVLQRKSYGGAISSSNAALALQHCLFSSNSAYTSGIAGSQGGAIYALNSHLHAVNCSFSADTAVGNGGAISTEGSAASPSILAACSFDRCIAINAFGGAINHQTASLLVINHSTFFSNRAGTGGAVALRSNSGSLSLLNSTLVSNCATDNYQQYLALP